MRISTTKVMASKIILRQSSQFRTIGTSTENPRGFTPIGQEAPISDPFVKFYKYAQSYHGSSPPKVLITGGLGQLGRSLAAIMNEDI
uniref:Uncharacterized protein n=1 Tax=Panagrolaimus superbus TaxID=310955 RepID=A0A914Z6P2_9BILA